MDAFHLIEIFSGHRNELFGLRTQKRMHENAKKTNIRNTRFLFSSSVKDAIFFWRMN